MALQAAELANNMEEMSRQAHLLRLALIANVQHWRDGLYKESGTSESLFTRMIRKCSPSIRIQQQEGERR